MSPDVVIVGGGPAGAAAALQLARAGARVVLAERQRGAHHKVCGEFVSVEAVRQLRDLELDPARLGAVPICWARVRQGRRSVGCDLPFAAVGLSRKTLDEALLRAAAAAGADVRRGFAVREVVREAGGVRVRLQGGETVAAGAAFLATGKHELRGQPRRRGLHDDLIGLKMHLAAPVAHLRPLHGGVELLLFRGGYAGLQLVGEDRANLCLVVARRCYEAAGDWSALLRGLLDATPAWRALLAEAVPRWPRPLAIFGIPYGHVAAAEDGPLFRIGDQFAVIPSLAGDGIAMALATGRLAADGYLAGGPSAWAYHRRAARAFGLRVRLAALGSRLLAMPAAQRVALGATRLAPSLLPRAATATRLGDRAAATEFRGT